ncbi:MAG: succinate dehydrogenase, cytochrome b556 subunit [Pseudomonadota bacterium]
MKQPDRPLSPHLSVYRWPITMALSILHRATGLANAVGLIVLAAWLTQAASGPEAYAGFVRLMGSVPGLLVLAGFSFSFFYHLCNGVRHLVWDSGRGFEKHQANASAWVAIVVALLLTAVFWGVAL